MTHYQRAARPLHRAAALLAASVALATAAVVGTAGAASAHVTVSGPEAEQGGYGVITFRMPTESDTASTVGLEVTLPSDTPLVFAATQPIPGWSAKVTTEDLEKPITSHGSKITSYVSTITWTANTPADGIEPGEFAQFPVEAGPFPEKESLSFPAKQTYSDGTVVDWNEKAEGGAEPEHPAPSLPLAAAAEGGHDHPSDEAAGATSAPAAENASSTSDSGGTTLGIIGLVVGAVGLVIAVIALLRGGRKQTGGA